MHPDVQALLAGSGPPPQITIPGADPNAGPSGAPGPSGSGSEDQPISLLKQMIDTAKQYLEVEPDEEDKATMAKVLSTLQGYLAKDQADRDKALGNPSVMRVLRKS